MLISEEYREQNRQLHETNEGYGTSGRKWAEVVRQLSQSGRKAILDYGAGKQTLKAALGPAYNVTCYDPCVPGLDAEPQPHPVVVCSDVLEHIEPDCLDAVLADLKRVTQELILVVVHTGPAQKTLPDGRNAHLIQEGSGYWTAKLLQHFEPLRTEWNSGKEFMAICRPRVI